MGRRPNYVSDQFVDGPLRERIKDMTKEEAVAYVDILAIWGRPQFREQREREKLARNRKPPRKA